MKGGRFLEHGETFIYFILYNRQRTRRSLTCRTAMSQCLTQKEPVKYTDKLIKSTTDTKLQRILAVNKKSNIGQYYCE